MATKLCVKACAITSAAIWSGAVLSVGIANALQPEYGGEFLKTVASIYPGYKARPTAGQVAVGAGYAAVDGAMGGALFAWLYNQFVR